MGKLVTGTPVGAEPELGRAPGQKWEGQQVGKGGAEGGSPKGAGLGRRGRGHTGMGQASPRTSSSAGVNLPVGAGHGRGTGALGPASRKSGVGATSGRAGD